MSTIAVSLRWSKPRTAETSTSLNDVTTRVKAWGRRGIVFGAGFGFVFGAIFVAIPYTSNVLTFGTLGTLLVGMVECAFIAGAFAALAATPYGKGVGIAAPFELILQDGRRSGVSFTRDVPLADYRSYPAQADRPPVLDIPENALGTTYALADAQDRLSTIDAWENGNTGP